MADRIELKHVPKTDATALVPSDARAGLVARGRRENSKLLLKKKQICLARVKANGKWGLIDREGTFAVEPRYGAIHRFRSGRSAFSYSSGLEGSLWGCMGPDGKEISSPQFELVDSFYEGLARVKYRGKFGFLQKDGTFAIEPRFDSASPGGFKDGTAAVHSGDVRHFIDRSGSLIGTTFDYLRDVSSGTAAQAQVGSKWGFVNRRGEFLIGPKFERPLDVPGGGWSARNGDTRTFVDYDGNAVISVTHAGIVSFYEGMICTASGEKGRCRSFVDTEGKTIFQWDEQKEKAETFHNGVCLVASANTAYFIDKTGRRLTNEPLRAVGRFVGKRGIVTDGEKFGYIDQAGRLVTPIEFQKAGQFVDGYAQVLTENGDWKWIDQNGAEVALPQFPEEGTWPVWIRPFESPRAMSPGDEERFHEGMCRVKSNGLWGFVDTQSQIVVRPTFPNARSYSCGLAAVQEDSGKWGYVNKAGNMAIPCQFEEAGNFEIIDME